MDFLGYYTRSASHWDHYKPYAQICTRSQVRPAAISPTTFTPVIPTSSPYSIQIGDPWLIESAQRPSLRRPLSGALPAPVIVTAKLQA